MNTQPVDLKPFLQALWAAITSDGQPNPIYRADALLLCLAQLESCRIGRVHAAFSHLPITYMGQVVREVIVQLLQKSHVVLRPQQTRDAHGGTTWVLEVEINTGLNNDPQAEWSTLNLHFEDLTALVVRVLSGVLPFASRIHSAGPVEHWGQLLIASAKASYVQPPAPVPQQVAATLPAPAAAETQSLPPVAP